ncbi:MAG: hypothetical protein U1F52_08205 [Burkholderiales bacterium]
MNQDTAEKDMGKMIDLVRQHLYAWKPFQVFGTMDVVPVIERVAGGTPNGNPTPAHGSQTRMGIQVTQGRLNLDDNAVRFGLAHELGHGFSEQLINTWGIQPLPGDCVPEVAADLGSAYLLRLPGVTWFDILRTAHDGVRTGIFDLEWSGTASAGQRAGRRRGRVLDEEAGG